MPKPKRNKTKFLSNHPRAPKIPSKKNTTPKVPAENVRIAVEQMQILETMVSQHIPMLQYEIGKKTRECEGLKLMCDAKTKQILHFLKNDYKTVKEKGELEATIELLRQEIVELKRSQCEKDHPIETSSAPLNEQHINQDISSENDLPVGENQTTGSPRQK